MTINQQDLNHDVRAIATRLLREGRVIGVVGLRSNHGHVGPHLFSSVDDDLANLILEPRYPLALVCQTILSEFPEGKLGVVVRGCDERALIEMAKMRQVEMERLEFIGLACSVPQARQCVCSRPYPQHIDVGERNEGFAFQEDQKAQKLLGQGMEERLAFWLQEFNRCIKCYGCRNACPVCICHECVLEEACWVERGHIPPQYSFHLIRAYHIADKCVGCGACVDVCPMEIPLTTLYALLRERLNDLFDYEPGLDVTQRSPLATTLEEVPIREL